MQNEKVFNIKLSHIRNFTVKILNYPISTSLSLLLSLQTIIMIAVAELSIRMVSIINIKKVVLTYIGKLITRLITTLSLKTIRILYIIKTINRETSVINFHLPIIATAKQKLRNFSTMTTGKMITNLSPIVATFYKLLVYDPQTLGDLDATTLGTMDHS